MMMMMMMMMMMLMLGDTRLQTGRHRQLVVSDRPRYTVNVADRRSAVPHRQRASTAGSRSPFTFLYVCLLCEVLAAVQ